MVRAIRATSQSGLSSYTAFSPSRTSSAPAASIPAAAQTALNVRLVLAAEKPLRPEGRAALPPSPVTRTTLQATHDPHWRDGRPVRGRAPSAGQRWPAGVSGAGWWPGRRAGRGGAGRGG